MWKIIHWWWRWWDFGWQYGIEKAEDKGVEYKICTCLCVLYIYLKWFLPFSLEFNSSIQTILVWKCSCCFNKTHLPVGLHVNIFRVLFWMFLLFQSSWSLPLALGTRISKFLCVGNWYGKIMRFSHLFKCNAMGHTWKFCTTGKWVGLNKLFM